MKDETKKEKKLKGMHAGAYTHSRIESILFTEYMVREQPESMLWVVHVQRPRFAVVAWGASVLVETARSCHHCGRFDAREEGGVTGERAVASTPIFGRKEDAWKVCAWSAAQKNVSCVGPKGVSEEEG